MPFTTSKGKSRLLSPASMGQANRSRVLELLHQNGPSSRAQIARALNVNRATIASILQPLIDNGTLVEGESVAASPAGGKPARPLWFSRDGIELGSMRIAANAITGARLGMDGTIHASAQREIDPNESIDSFEAAILAVADECFDGRNLIGIGIAASGMVDTNTGVIISLHLAPVLNNYPLRDVLTRRFHVPVTVDHHPRVQALGDKWFGHGRQLANFASVYTGEALGFGIVYNNEIIRGEAGAGGEYGHTVLDMNGDRCLCGRIGCWETVATLAWLRKEADRRRIRHPEQVDCALLTRNAKDGDSAAVELLELYAQNLAIGMANNEHMIASGTYIMHGDVCAGGDQMQRLLQARMEAYCPHRGTKPNVILADVPDQTTLLGGGGLVLSSILVTAV